MLCPIIGDATASTKSESTGTFPTDECCGNGDMRFGFTNHSLAKKGEIATPIGVAAPTHAVIKAEGIAPVSAELADRRQARGEVVGDGNIASVDASILTETKREAVITKIRVVPRDFDAGCVLGLRARRRKRC